MTPEETEQLRQQLEKLAYLLDSRYRIPILGWRFGWDALLGLIPVIGDTATFVLTAYLTVTAYRLGVPYAALMQMIWNALLDWGIGQIPVVGDAFDVRWKANKKNIELLNCYLAEQTYPVALLSSDNTVEK